MWSLVAKFMGPMWGPPGSCRHHADPMLATWTLLYGVYHRREKRNDDPYFVACRYVKMVTVRFICGDNQRKWKGRSANQRQKLSQHTMNITMLYYWKTGLINRESIVSLQLNNQFYMSLFKLCFTITVYTFLSLLEFFFSFGTCQYP